MNVDFVEIGTEQIPAIQSLANVIWPPTFSAIISSTQLSYMLNMMYSEDSLTRQMNSGSVFLLAMEGEKEVGFASYELNYKGTSKTKIHKLYLLPETQGKGYGRKMIDHIAAIAKENEQTAITLNVNRFNTAYSFYLKTGFVKTAEEDIDIGQGYLMEDFVLEKAVS